jgi:hypothetical protein
MNGGGEQTLSRRPCGEGYSDRTEFDVEITENDTSSDEPVASVPRFGPNHHAARANPLEALALMRRLRGD